MLDEMTLAELKELAKEQNIKNVSKFTILLISYLRNAIIHTGVKSCHYRERGARSWIEYTIAVRSAEATSSCQSWWKNPTARHCTGIHILNWYGFWKKNWAYWWTGKKRLCMRETASCSPLDVPTIHCHQTVLP